MRRELVGAAAVVLIAATSLVVIIDSPALASCANTHQNYEGQDAGNGHDYGNKADILVNNINYSSLNNSIHRSLFILYTYDPQTGAFTNDAEVGWTANNSGFTNPHPYFEWVVDGADSNIIIDGSTVLAAGSTHTFKVQDSDGNGTWKGYLDGTQLDVSPVIDTPYGRPITNSERRNTCDTGKAHFTNLAACSIRPPCSWSSMYNDLRCYYTAGTAWDFDKVDNTNHWINQTGIDC